MDPAPEPRRRPKRAHLVVLGALWVVALLAAYLFTGENVVEEDLRAVGRRLEDALWVLPLAVAVSATVLSIPPARRWLPQLSHRILVGLIASVGLYALAAAIAPGSAVLVVGLAAMLGLLAAWVLILPRQLAPPLPAETLAALGDRDRLELSDGRLKLQNDLRTTALQAIAGLAILAGAILAFQQLSEDRQQSTAARELAVQGQASERFTRAIDQLGSDRTEVRVGGIYGLEQIARQAPDNRLAVIEVLVAYLHRSSPRLAESTTDRSVNVVGPAPEAQAAITVLARRRPLVTDRPLDLSNLDLSGVRIRGERLHSNPNNPAGSEPDEFGGFGYAYWIGNLRSVNLSGTDLRGATFSEVYLQGADLSGTDLRGADFSLANPAPVIVELDPQAEQAPGPVEGVVTLDNVDFTGALADSSTKWPTGFDWQAAGVKMEAT
jgi:Pentapeptide repeats (8 copies)